MIKKGFHLKIWLLLFRVFIVNFSLPNLVQNAHIWRTLAWEVIKKLSTSGYQVFGMQGIVIFKNVKSLPKKSLVSKVGTSSY